MACQGQDTLWCWGRLNQGIGKRLGLGSGLLVHHEHPFLAPEATLTTAVRLCRGGPIEKQIAGGFGITNIACMMEWRDIVTIL